jgi:DNA-3-methyladenine glycosylase II
MDAIFKKLIKKDPKLKPVLDTDQELPLSNHTGDIYFDLVRTIAYQQLHGAAAAKIFGRFIDLFEDAYPLPQIVAEMELEEFRAVGYSKQKSSYIKNIAAFALENDFEHRDWDSMEDDEIVRFLTQIKGVGEWTAQIILLFSLRRLDVFPSGDFGIQSAMIKRYKLKQEKKELIKKMKNIAEAWRPHRSIVSRHLWLWTDGNK